MVRGIVPGLRCCIWVGFPEKEFVRKTLKSPSDCFPNYPNKEDVRWRGPLASSFVLKISLCLWEICHVILKHKFMCSFFIYCMALIQICWAHCVCCHFSQSSLNGFTAQLRPILVWPKLWLSLVPKSKSKSQFHSIPFPLLSFPFSVFFLFLCAYLPPFLQMEMFSYWKQNVTF